MKIRSTVRIATFITITVILIHSGFDAFINQALENKEQDLQKVTDIRIAFNQLRAVSTDYALHQTEGARQQWWAVHDNLLQMLNNAEYQAFQGKYHIDVLGDRVRLMADAFTNLAAAMGKAGLRKPEVEDNKELRSRSINQIRLIAHEIVSSLVKISEEISRDKISFGRQEDLLDIIALFTLISLIMGNSIFLSRSVVKPVLQLHEGAEIIGRGNLDHRVETSGQGEIQELSQAFNEMAANLMKVTVSRDELAREAKERQQAQEALRRAHQDLEQRVRERTAELRRTVDQLQEEVTERQQAEKALRDSEQSLRCLASRIITAQEQERKRIAMELHEGLGQSMTALKMYLRYIQRHLPTEAVKIREDFENARNLLFHMVEEVRHISRNLSPALLEGLGLPAALKHLLDEFSKYQDVTIKADIEDIQNLFSSQTEINLFRIFQESLNNIAKHAQATQVSVSVKRQNGQVNLIIKDNGIGFDLEQIKSEEIADKGMGLTAMEERLRMLGTRLNILSQKDNGTEINFSIPVDAQ
ncbi:MAG: HAMP domain-containing protein [Syntrophales bacterium]